MEHATRSGAIEGADGRDVHVRNLDVTRTHRVDVRVRDADGVELERSVLLRRGAADRDADALPAGEYDVAVHVDGTRQVFDEVDLRGPDRRLLVAVGNGIVHVGDDGAL
jgi:hypothetical protein